MNPVGGRVLEYLPFLSRVPSRPVVIASARLDANAFKGGFKLWETRAAKSWGEIGFSE
jgi:hypothetical protein